MTGKVGQYDRYFHYGLWNAFINAFCFEITKFNKAKSITDMYINETDEENSFEERFEKMYRVEQNHTIKNIVLKEIDITKWGLSIDIDYEYINETD